MTPTPPDRLTDARVQHQSLLAPEENKFHIGNGDDGKHYWLTPPALYAELDAEFHFDFDPCPFPLPTGFDGLTCEWGSSSYVNPPFGSIIHDGKKKGPTAWVRKAIAEHAKGKTVVLVYPIDKWVLMLLREILGEHAEVRNLGDVRWLATEDGSEGKGTGRHIAAFVLRPRELLAFRKAGAEPRLTSHEQMALGAGIDGLRASNLHGDHERAEFLVGVLNRYAPLPPGAAPPPDPRDGLIEMAIEALEDGQRALRTLSDHVHTRIPGGEHLWQAHAAAELAKVYATLVALKEQRNG